MHGCIISPKLLSARAITSAVADVDVLAGLTLGASTSIQSRMRISLATCSWRRCYLSTTGLLIAVQRNGAKPTILVSLLLVLGCALARRHRTAVSSVEEGITALTIECVGALFSSLLDS